VSFEGFVVEKVSDAIEDAAAVDGEAIANQLSSDTLDDVTFSDAGRSDQNGVVVFTDEVASGQVVNLFSLY
tara:strand:- start:8270 stop:8482 length:213 start_codon:yes stop_codon:yes gene_type:complete